ncbi:phosphoesterase, MJ0936 family [Anaerobranca californiensis DSM 14826]|jgi:putative phosphoesterase|uniref:Phosphoesterase n=1 Tax=Anaerobranca californiensis DSM 14826 TaxID=1120989 RepID=A0A1M6LKV7_9FIRM|nr:metallophosphoesterase family protein [Anaerobranca californiensis]SHJ71834.1 phosphoesterase, MJ0936 family [Anaerobranca californiensis DSM 14826]
MKIAVISDIHSNIEALNSVLNKIQEENCQQIICLGDLVGYGPHPNEVIERIKGLNIPTILGNYDEAVGFYLPSCGCKIDNEWQKKQSENSLKWTQNHTSEINKKWLRGLPEELFVEYNGKKIYATHGSPNAINEYIYESEVEKIKEVLENIDVDIILLGHTHFPYIKKYKDKLILNPGSVGKPKDGDNRGSFAQIQFENGQVTVQIIRVSYDIDKVVADINKTSLLKEFGLMLKLGKVLE